MREIGMKVIDPVLLVQYTPGEKDLEDWLSSPRTASFIAAILPLFSLIDLDNNDFALGDIGLRN